MDEDFHDQMMMNDEPLVQLPDEFEDLYNVLDELVHPPQNPPNLEMVPEEAKYNFPETVEAALEDIAELYADDESEDVNPATMLEDMYEAPHSSVLKKKLENGTLIRRRTRGEFLEYQYSNVTPLSSSHLVDETFEKIFNLLDIDTIFSLQQVCSLFLDIWRKLKNVKMLNHSRFQSPELTLKLFRRFLGANMQLESVEINSPTSRFTLEQSNELFHLMRELRATKISLNIMFPAEFVPAFGEGVTELGLRNCSYGLGQPKFHHFGMDHLTVLNLDSVQFGPINGYGEISLRLGTLKKLSIKSCLHSQTLTEFQISCDKLQILSIYNTPWCRNNSVTLRVSSSALTELELKGNIYRKYIFSDPWSKSIVRAIIELEGDVRSLDLGELLVGLQGCLRLQLSKNSLFEPCVEFSQTPNFDRLISATVEGFSDANRVLLERIFEKSGAEVLSGESTEAPEDLA